MSDQDEINKRVSETFDHLNDLHLDVVRTHISIHQMLNNLLWSRLGGEPSSDFRGLGFSQSVELALIGHYDASLLERLRALNAARNEISHSFEFGKFAQKLERFLKKARRDEQYTSPAEWGELKKHVADATHDLLFEVVAVTYIGQKEARERRGV